ncbi:histidine phosphatase superfamily (branch 2) domain-containing protein [Ditylenchus destructor]|nr:histidine phosphatase superfamily (branch 2) domain-containing protein [Ditylenchus destructor]
MTGNGIGVVCLGMVWIHLAGVWCRVELAESRAQVKTLRFVHAIWRHGDRTPSTIIPSDTNNSAGSWKQGLGELTKLGMSQQYRLGQYLRQRYDGFLSKEYSPFEIYLRSSDYNRTLTSAQANMAGLFEPTDQEMFLKELKWRPIPVHTMPKGTDKILFDSIFCPTATTEEQSIYGGPEVRAIEKENEAMLTYLGEKSGYGKIPLPLRDLWYIFDPLNSENSHPEDHTLPSWVNSTVKAEIWRLYDISSYYLFGSDLLTRLRGGALFNDVLSRMKSVAFGMQDPREKFYGYSAHDTSVAGILAGFGVHPKEFPPYSSLVLVELHQVEGRNFVQFFYKNVTDGTDLFEHEIAGCDAPCTLEKLEVARQHVIPLNWEEECGIFRWYNNFNTRTYLFVIGVLVVLCCALSLEVLLTQRKLRQLKSPLNESQRRDIMPSQKSLLQSDEEDELDVHQRLYP